MLYDTLLQQLGKLLSIEAQLADEREIGAWSSVVTAVKEEIHKLEVSAD